MSGQIQFGVPSDDIENGGSGRTPFSEVLQESQPRTPAGSSAAWAVPLTTKGAPGRPRPAVVPMAIPLSAANVAAGVNTPLGNVPVNTVKPHI